MPPPTNLDNIHCHKCPPNSGTFNRNAHQVVMDHGVATVICPLGHTVWLDALQNVQLKQQEAYNEQSQQNYIKANAGIASRLPDDVAEEVHSSLEEFKQAPWGGVNLQSLGELWTSLLTAKARRSSFPANPSGIIYNIDANDVENMLHLMEIAKVYK